MNLHELRKVSETIAKSRDSCLFVVGRFPKGVVLFERANRLEGLTAELSDWRTVDALRPIIRKMAAKQPGTMVEAYIKHLEEAAILLASGFEPEEMIRCFRIRLYYQK